MEVRTIAILSPGDMGHAIGARLVHHGLRVITCLAGRSSRTVALAQRAGITDVPTDDDLVLGADVILSILVPSRALETAARVASAAGRTGASPVFVDCNAISPATVREVEKLFNGTNVRFVDAGILGGPPKEGSVDPRLYMSGLHAELVAGPLSRAGIDARVVGPEIGQASGLKMCYAAVNKGLTALATEAVVASRALGLAEVFAAEMEASQPMLMNAIQQGVPKMPPKAYRWVGEMEEIAKTYESLGLTPKMFEGAAELFKFVEGTELGKEVPEERKKGETMDEVAEILVAALPRRSL